MDPHLRVYVLPEGKTEFVVLEEGDSLQQVLDDFLNRAGRFAGEWVHIKAGTVTRYVRYDQVVRVEANLAEIAGHL